MRMHLRLSASLVLFSGLASIVSAPSLRAQSVTVNAAPVQTGIKRIGINLSHPSYYDSAQMLKNFAYKTFGFEGNEVRAIVQCTKLTANTCTSSDPWSSWPSGFASGFTYEVLGGPAKGATGSVSNSANNNQNSGECGAGIACGAQTLTLSGSTSSWGTAPYIAIRGTKSGLLANPQDVGPQGLWITGTLGKNYAASSDTCGSVCGTQSLDANLGAGSGVTQLNYFDSTAGHMFVVMHGQYGGSFYAKLKSGNGSNAVNVQAYRSNPGVHSYLKQNVSLPADGQWHKYTINTVSIDETSLNPSSNEVAAISFTVAAGNEVLLDNEMWGPVNGLAANTSAFRDDVYNTLLSLKPGVLRYMDDDNNAGYSLDSLIAPDGQRKFSTPSVNGSGQGGGYVSYSLDQFLHLCALVGAEPWFTVPATFTSADMVNLTEYLAGPSNTTYGAKRAAQGQSAPWTSVFKTIHLELGNEMWNSGFASAMPDTNDGAVGGQAQYGQHADRLFNAMKTAPDWQSNSAHIDLVKSGWNTNQVTGDPMQGAGAYWISHQKTTGQTETANHISEAPYLMGKLSDCSSNSTIFQTAFAEGYVWDQPTSNAGLECALGTSFSGSCSGGEIYEVNFGTSSSSCTQAQTTNATSSLGMAVALGSHMLQMQKNDGIETQNIFALPEYANGCGGSVACPLWGVVLDMGGGTNSRLRPSGLVMKLINDAISGMTTEITTSQSGVATFSSAASANDDMPGVSGIPQLESHAYTDGAGHYSEIFINKSLTSSMTVSLNGITPSGAVSVEKLTSKNITDNNETASVVPISTSTFTGKQPVSVPPFSMVSIRW